MLECRLSQVYVIYEPVVGCWRAMVKVMVAVDCGL